MLRRLLESPEERNPKVVIALTAQFVESSADLWDPRTEWLQPGGCQFVECSGDYWNPRKKVVTRRPPIASQDAEFDPKVVNRLTRRRSVTASQDVAAREPATKTYILCAMQAGQHSTKREGMRKEGEGQSKLAKLNEYVGGGGGGGAVLGEGPCSEVILVGNKVSTFT